MPNFEEMFEEVVGKAKVYADAAGKKTNEMVGLGKLKYQGKQIAWEIDKTYSRLGAVVYESRKNHETAEEAIDFEKVICAAVEELDNLNAQLDEIEEKILEMRRPDFRGQHAEEEEDMEAPEEEVVVEVFVTDDSEDKPE